MRIADKVINSEEDGCFRTWSTGTPREGEASTMEACTIGNRGKEIATDNDVQTEVALDKLTGTKTILAPVPEALAVGPQSRRETGETEGGGGKAKDVDDETEEGGREDPSTPIPDTSAVRPKSRRETERWEVVARRPRKKPQ